MSDTTPESQAVEPVELRDTFADASLEMTGSMDKFRVGNLTGKPGLLADAQSVELAKAGTLVATRKQINLIAGSGMTVNATDNPGANRVDVTLLANSLSWEPPVGFALVASAATLDVSAARNFVCTNTITGNTTLTLINGVDGMHGTVQLKNDATGGASRTLTFTVAGRTRLMDLNVGETNPITLGNQITEYHYYYCTIGGTAYIRIYKVFLWAP